MRLCLLILAPLTFAACAGHDNMMSDHADLFAEHSSSYQSALSDHHRQVAAATDISNISTLEEQHHQRVTSHMAGMRHEMADMMSCMGSGGVWTEGAAATDGMGAMDDECTRHADAMTGAADIDAAHTEEDAHQQTMADVMDRMLFHAGRMMSGTTSMMCSHHQD